MRGQRFPWWGWLGAAVLVAGNLLITFTDWYPVHLFFTPWMWTGYILVADALLLGRQGVSWLSPRPGRLLLLLPISLACWLLFEAYNLHLRNWDYVGLPEDRALEVLGYVWSFVTIWPGLLITADLVESLGLEVHSRPMRVTPRLKRTWLVAGLLMAAIPVLLPAHLAAYTFVAVWIAWVPLIEPLLVGQEGLPSLLRDLGEGDRTRWVSLAISGLVCGLLWESWNWMATARWVYTFPMFQEWKIFEMPAPGFLGFIPFAWEAQSMYALVLLFLSRLLRRTPDGVLRPPLLRRTPVPGS